MESCQRVVVLHPVSRNLSLGLAIGAECKGVCRLYRGLIGYFSSGKNHYFVRSLASRGCRVAGAKADLSLVASPVSASSCFRGRTFRNSQWIQFVDVSCRRGFRPFIKLASWS